MLRPKHKFEHEMKPIQSMDIRDHIGIVLDME
jgi:hypothetical protein